MMRLADAKEFVSQGWAMWRGGAAKSAIQLTSRLTELERARTNMPIGQVLSYQEKMADGSPGPWQHSPRALSWGAQGRMFKCLQLNDLVMTERSGS